MNTLPTPNLLQGQGILYVRSEYYQANGLSVILHGGEFRPLTTVYEWWIDASNPWRFRRMTTELLEGAPQVVGADGSDGTTGWWLIDRARGMTSPERHEGRFPLTETGKEFTFNDWLKIFQRQSWIEAWRNGEAQEVSQSNQSPWGDLVTLRKIDEEYGYVSTATVRVDSPNILVEEITTDKEGEAFDAVHTTNWDWLDPNQLGADFWMTPP